jgi:signal transduction histidine kinase
MIDPTLKNANILIVDDQPANIELLAGFLEMEGYTNIKTETDPRKVVRLFTSFAPDLILLDLAMPYLSGFEVLENLKPIITYRTFVPILVLTADITKIAKQRALSEGASDFLTKPFDLVEVGLRIKNLLFTKYLVQQLENQKQILEVKVNERTAALMQNNIELMAARDKAEASNRLKTAFMNNISHEIRTPLNGILGFAPLAIDPSFGEADKQEFLRILNYSSKRLMQTVTDYMDISLITSGNMDAKNAEFAPSTVINEIIKQFQPQIEEKKIDLIIDKPEPFDTLIINSDKEILKKILSHLVDNALKFTQKGSITIGISLKINQIEFYVKDTGIGISSENLSIIFDHFSQADTSSTRGHEGSGLGLAIIKGLVSIAGGEIKAESTKDKGSIFSFTIPWDESTENNATTEIPSYGVSDVIRPKLLIAEDENIGFLYLKLALETSFEIIRAEDGEEAVELCKLIPDLQLVLMDVKMPKMNGLEATQKIKKIRKDLPIIVLTAFAESGMREKCMSAGCDEYIPKPITLGDLFQVMAKFGINN